jgi:hypothetical protein
MISPLFSDNFVYVGIGQLEPTATTQLLHDAYALARGYGCVQFLRRSQAKEKACCND